jgi:hypothetical protein
MVPDIIQILFAQNTKPQLEVLRESSKATFHMKMVKYNNKDTT